jgi:hypothetical protein
MDCDATALTCAVRDVAEALRGGPSVFEVVSQVVVPLLLGVSTLLVAWLSFRVGKRSNVLAEEARRVSTRAIAVAEQSNEVARESHRLSKQVREDAIADRLRKEREEFVASCQEWLALELGQMREWLPHVRERASSLEYALIARATTLDNPNGLSLVQFLRTSFELSSRLDPSWNKSSWINVRAQYALSIWLRNPHDTDFESAL